MTQQERLKKIFEENALSPNIFLDGDSQDCVVLENVIDCDTFLRVASELLEEREKCQCGLTLNVTVGILRWAGGFVLSFSPGTTARHCNPDGDLMSSQPCVNAYVICRNFNL